MINKEDQLNVLKVRIKLLEGKKNCKIKDDPDILDSIEDINNQIQALTNMLEML